MQPQHTPGPWRICTRSPNYVERDIPSVATIAVCYDPSRAHADARLIAAAPDLVYALRALTPRLATNGHVDWHLVESARAALAKAEGR